MVEVEASMAIAETSASAEKVTMTESQKERVGSENGSENENDSDDEDDSSIEETRNEGGDAGTAPESTLARLSSNTNVDGNVPKDKKGKQKLSSAQQPISRELGKSILPFSRVQKIVKADKEITIVAKEAVFLISLATEEFIKKFMEASGGVARRDNRRTVQHKDLATVVRKSDEFLFLEEIIPWIAPEPPAKRPKKTQSTLKQGKNLAETDETAMDSQPSVLEMVQRGGRAVTNDDVQHSG